MNMLLSGRLHMVVLHNSVFKVFPIVVCLAAAIFVIVVAKIFRSTLTRSLQLLFKTQLQMLLITSYADNNYLDGKST